MSFCNATAGIGDSFWTDGNERMNGRTDEQMPDGQTGVGVQIVIKISVSGLELQKNDYQARLLPLDKAGCKVKVISF